MARYGARTQKSVRAGGGTFANVTIEHDSAVPPYRQLAAILRDQIRSGELAPGAMVPPVKRLRAEYGVAETTARKAVALLREEDLVETVMGWGSFVRKDIAR
jgi:DNA-binding GntR family transcriptional regulator